MVIEQLSLFSDIHDIKLEWAGMCSKMFAINVFYFSLSPSLYTLPSNKNPSHTHTHVITFTHACTHTYTRCHKNFLFSFYLVSSFLALLLCLFRVFLSHFLSLSRSLSLSLSVSLSHSLTSTQRSTFYHSVRNLLILQLHTLYVSLSLLSVHLFSLFLLIMGSRT